MTWRLWHLVLGVVLAAIALLGYFLDWGGSVITWWRDKQECERFVTLAESECQIDNFEKCIYYYAQAQRPCRGAGDVTKKKAKAETFKIATEYDQTHFIRDKEILTKLDDHLRELDARQLDPEVIALRGIVKDLQDHPIDGIAEYKRSVGLRSGYPNAHNYWGYTIYKWKIGADTWAEKALEEFSRARDLDPNYPLPYLNAALIHVKQGDLEEAEEALRKAETLLPKNPRVHLLWGTLHGVRAKRLGTSAPGKAHDHWMEAKRHFTAARDLNRKLADARFLLAAVLEELRVPEAAYEYRRATELSPLDINACWGRAQFLQRQKARVQAAKERARCRDVIRTLSADLSARRDETSDEVAKDWLWSKMEEYKEIQKSLAD